MVASIQVEIPYYRRVGRQRERGFCALAQVIGRTAIPFLRRYVVPAAKRIGADMFEFAAPEIGKVISDRKSSTSAAKNVGKQNRKKHLGSGCKQRKIIPTVSTKQSSRSRRDIFANISRWSCQTPTFGTNLLWQYLGGKVPTVDDVLSSHEQEVYPTSSFDENCIEVEFQTDRNFYVDLRQSFWH